MKAKASLIVFLWILILFGSCSTSHKMVMPNRCKPVKQKKYSMVMPNGCKRKKAQDTPTVSYVRPSNSGGNIIVTERKYKRRKR